MGKIGNAFRGMQEKFGDPKPDQTGDMLGIWPAQGEHECYITHIDTDEKHDFFIKMDSGKRVSCPGTSIRFWYQLTNDPDNPDNPMQWGGQPFQFPDELTDQFEDNKLTMLRMDRNRLCGHLKCLLGIDVGGDTGLPEDTALEQVHEKLNGDTETICIVKAQYSKGKKKPDKDGNMPDKAPEYRKEFLLKLIGT